MGADRQTPLSWWKESRVAEPTKEKGGTQPQSTNIICWEQIISRLYGSTEWGLTFCTMWQRRSSLDRRARAGSLCFAACAIIARERPSAVVKVTVLLQAGNRIGALYQFERNCCRLSRRVCCISAALIERKHSSFFRQPYFHIRSIGVDPHWARPRWALVDEYFNSAHMKVFFPPFWSILFQFFLLSNM